MREFIKNKKVTYNLISFTGFKALLLFSLLVDGPKTYIQIADKFRNHPYLKESIAPDTVRVYINSMRKIGCEILSERDGKTYYYRLVYSPYMLDINENQVKGLIKVYKLLSSTTSIEELLDLHEFLLKLKDYVKDESVLEKINNASIIKGVNIDILKQLIKLVKQKEQIIFTYASTNTTTKDIDMLLEDFVIKNNKIYIKGLSKNYDNKLLLLVNRVKKIKEVKKVKDITSDMTNVMKIRYEYFGDINDFDLNNDERIIEKLTDRIVVEIDCENEFFARQRILSFADKARVISPESYRKQFIKCLQEMEKEYSVVR